MTDSVIGIDFGSSGIKLAEVRTVKGTSTVIKQAYMPLEPGFITDGAPDPKMVTAIAAELKTFLANEKFTTRDAVMGLNSVDDIFVNRANAPWHPPKEFHSAVAFDIVADPSLLLGAPEGVILDAVVFGEFVDPKTEKRKLDVLLCGVTSKLVESQVEILQKAGLNPSGADLAGLAALRAITRVDRPADNLDVVVDIGADALTVLIHDNGKPFSLTLQTGAAGQEASNTIAEALADDDVERVSREKVNFSRDYRVRQAVDDYCFKASGAIHGAIQSYLNLRKSPASIAGITLIGGGALLEGLRESIEQSMRISTVIGKFDPSIQGDPARYFPGQVLSADYTVAVGLAMGATA